MLREINNILINHRKVRRDVYVYHIVLILSMSTIFQLDFRTVLTVFFGNPGLGKGTGKNAAELN
jgi:predicted ATPase